MQFHAVLISLYRPYLSTSLQRRVANLSSSDDQAQIRDVVVDCVDAASQIAELLRCYQRQHSLVRLNIQIVHLIFTASLVFVFDVCSRTYADARTSLRNLQFCCHALGEIGQCYGNATRALEVIILVKSEWQKLVMARQARLSSLTSARPGSHHHYHIPAQFNGESTTNRWQDRQPNCVPEVSSRAGGNQGYHDVASVGGSRLGKEPDPFAPPPPSFSAFEMLCDRYVRQPTAAATMESRMPPPQSSEDLQIDKQLMLGDPGMPPQMDWLEDDELAAMVQQSLDDGSNMT